MTTATMASIPPAAISVTAVSGDATTEVATGPLKTTKWDENRRHQLIKEVANVLGEKFKEYIVIPESIFDKIKKQLDNSMDFESFSTEEIMNEFRYISMAFKFLLDKFLYYHHHKFDFETFQINMTNNDWVNAISDFSSRQPSLQDLQYIDSLRFTKLGKAFREMAKLYETNWIRTPDRECLKVISYIKEDDKFITMVPPKPIFPPQDPLRHPKSHAPVGSVLVKKERMNKIINDSSITTKSGTRMNALQDSMVAEIESQSETLRASPSRSQKELQPRTESNIASSSLSKKTVPSQLISQLDSELTVQSSSHPGLPAESQSAPQSKTQAKGLAKWKPQSSQFKQCKSEVLDKDKLNTETPRSNSLSSLESEPYLSAHEEVDSPTHSPARRLKRSPAKKQTPAPNLLELKASGNIRTLRRASQEDILPSLLHSPKISKHGPSSQPQAESNEQLNTNIGKPLQQSSPKKRFYQPAIIPATRKSDILDSCQFDDVSLDLIDAIELLGAPREPIGNTEKSMASKDSRRLLPALTKPKTLGTKESSRKADGKKVVRNLRELGIVQLSNNSDEGKEQHVLNTSSHIPIHETRNIGVEITNVNELNDLQAQEKVTIRQNNTEVADVLVSSETKFNSFISISGKSDNEPVPVETSPLCQPESEDLEQRRGRRSIQNRGPQLTLAKCEEVQVDLSPEPPESYPVSTLNGESSTMTEPRSAKPLESCKKQTIKALVPKTVTRRTELIKTTPGQEPAVLSSSCSSIITGKSQQNEPPRKKIKRSAPDTVHFKIVWARLQTLQKSYIRNVLLITDEIMDSIALGIIDQNIEVLYNKLCLDDRRFLLLLQDILHDAEER